MKKAVFAGSFDPFTLGHKDIVMRASELFDQVIVAVASDTGKGSHAVDERKKTVSLSLPQTKNVVIDEFKGLLTKYMDSIGCKILIRGVRTAADYEYERSLMAIYRSLKSDIEFVLLPAKAEMIHISSTIVRRLAELEAPLSGYVDTKAEEYIRRIYGVK